MGSVRAVIFDLGNVLVRWDPRFLYRRLFPDTEDGRAAMERFLSEIVPLDPFNRRIDLGEDIAALCEEVVAAHPEIDPMLIRAYNTHKHEMWGGTIDDTVNIHAALRGAGVPCFALSNWGQDFALAERTYPVLSEFDGRVISQDEGFVKPDPAIFEILLSRFNLRAEECLFIDDNAANIVAANELGFITHRFTHPIRLRAHLDGLGVLPVPVADGWVPTATSLQRTLRFADFNEAWAFMSLVADSAEQLGHHPDWSNSWATVNITLTTHDKGNTVTTLDRVMAAEINRSVGAALKQRAWEFTLTWVGHLLDGDTDTAFQMLSERVRSEVAVDDFVQQWAAVSHDQDPFVERLPGAVETTWPAQTEYQIQRLAVEVSSHRQSVSISATVEMRGGAPRHLAIDDYRFTVTRISE
jgi:2-haloacid dehalogenase